MYLVVAFDYGVVESLGSNTAVAFDADHEEGKNEVVEVVDALVRHTGSKDRVREMRILSSPEHQEGNHPRSPKAAGPMGVKEENRGAGVDW